MWMWLSGALMLTTGLVTAVYLARLLGPARYGRYALAVTVVVWLELAITVVFSKATIKAVGEAADWRPVGAAALRVHVVASLLAMAAVWAFADWIAARLNEPVLGVYLRLFAIDIPIFAVSWAHRNILVGLGQFRRRAMLSAGRWTSRLVLIVVLVELGFSVTGALLGGVGASLVELVIARVYVRPKLLLPGFPTSQLLGAGAMLLLFEISMRLFDRLDLFSLKLLGGTADEAGVYAVAQNLALPLTILGLGLGPVLLSTVSRLLRDGRRQEASQLERNTVRAIFGLFPLGALVAGASGEIVGLLFGARYAPAAPLLSILVFAAMSKAKTPRRPVIARSPMTLPMK